MNDIKSALNAGKQTMAEKLAAYTLSLSYEDIPGEVIHQVKRVIADTLGCGFGGYDSEPGKMARLMAERISSSQPATILYSGQKTSAELAAFANDVTIRYLDFNDGYISNGGGHPSDVISALLASAEVSGASGRDLVLATVLAYELYCRFVDTWSYRTSGVDQCTVIGIAIAAAAGRLFRLNRKQLVEAINLTVVANIALRQTRTGHVSPWKACASANAGRNALFAVGLAQCGMAGPSPIFEGRFGFFNVVSHQTFDIAAFGGRDEPFRIMKCHLKQFPLGNHAQTMVSAVLEARTLIGANIDAIEQINIRASHKAVEIMASDPEKWRPGNRETADHSIPYTAGVAMKYGTIDESFFDDRYLHDEELLNLIGKIKCSASEEANARAEETFLCDIEVILRSGERKSTRGEYHRGHWRNPMSDAEIESKFRSLVKQMLPAARTDALLAQLWDLDKLAKISTLMQMTQRQS